MVLSWHLLLFLPYVANLHSVYLGTTNEVMQSNTFYLEGYNVQLWVKPFWRGIEFMRIFEDVVSGQLSVYHNLTVLQATSSKVQGLLQDGCIRQNLF